ncbi:hypothetical protein ES705_46338 [subsurface metagenome]
MAKRKYPSELNTRSIRVNIGDWHLLMELARQHDTTVAKVLHLAITKQAASSLTVAPRTQIPMALNTTYQVIPELAIAITPQSIIATNGSKGVAFRIKTKGVRYA